jgi:hypothetical protein
MGEVPRWRHTSSCVAERNSAKRHRSNLRTTNSRECAVGSRRARIQGSWAFVSLNSRLESDTKEKKELLEPLGHARRFQGYLRDRFEKLDLFSQPLCGH